jgi:hypothetical protein
MVLTKSYYSYLEFNIQVLYILIQEFATSVDVGIRPSIFGGVSNVEIDGNNIL